jgi:TP901 family phage tail tape measure protein
MSEATNDARVNVYINGKSGIAEIDKLERKMQKLGKEINRVGQDSDIGKKMAEDLKLAQLEMNKLTKDIDITKLSIKQLENESRRLKRLRDTIEPSSKEFHKLNGEIKQLDDRLKVVKTGMGSFGQSMQLVWDQLKGFNLAVVGVLAGGAIVNFFKDIIKGAAELSDQLADVQKTTGMTSREVKSLNQELSSIDTRTSTKELRNMAIVAGQIGTAKEDVADFVEAVDVANVALGDEFTGGAQQVAEEMGKLRNVFTDFRSNNVSRDILQISNALNVLGAEGAATGPVVAENANRIGGFGIQAGLSTGQVLGLAASMQELNINSERGSTAITRILQKMLTDVETFAQVAGMSTKEFKKTLDTDLFGAFMKVVEGSKKVGSSNTALAKVIQELDVDGAGASEVMAKFGGNLELIREKSETATNALKSQDSIMKEFSLKNENAAAVAEKFGKAINGWFTRKFIEPAENFLIWLGKATGLTKELSEKTEQERFELLMLENRLNDLNLKQEDRIKLIKQLQEKYPDYLGNLDAEKVTSQQLSGAIKQINEDLINKIILQKADEEFQKKAEKAAERAIKTRELKEQLELRLVKIREKDSSIYIPEGDILKKAEFVKKQLELKNTGTFDKSGVGFALLKKELSDYIHSLSLQNEKTKDANEALSERDKLAKELGITLDDVAQKEEDLGKKAKSPAGSGIAPTMPEDDEKKKKKFKLGIDLRISELERYNKAMLEVRKEIENLHKTETEIAVDQATEKTDALLEENSRLQSELMFSIQFGNKQEREFAQKRLRELMQEEVELNAIRIRQTIEVEKKIEAERVKNRKEAAAKILNELKSPQQREIDEIQTHYAELIALAQKYGIDSSELVKKREALILEVQKAYNAKSEEEKKKSLDKIANIIGDYGQSAQNILNPVAQLVSTSAEKQISSIEDQANKRLETLDKQRERGIINEEQYQKKKLAIEKKTQKEIGQQRRKQAIADRIAAQASVAFSTAQAVMKALASFPPPASYVFAAAAGVAGALQSAAIWAAPMPTYKYGGTFGGVPDGPSHENGGISLVNSQSGRKVGEMEGGEPYMILSKQMYGNNRELIDKLLQISMYESGRRLTANDFAPSAPQMNYRTAMSASNGRRAVNRTVDTGGSSGNGRNPIVSGKDQSAELFTLMFEELRALREERKIPIRAFQVIRDTEETAKEYTRITSLAAIGESKSGKTKTVTRTSSSSGAGSTTIIEGQPGPQGPAGIDGSDGVDGSGLGLFQFLRW